MIKHPEQRVAVFIDTQNMYYSAKNLYDSRVNFKNILEDAVAGRKLTRAIAYVVRTKSGEERPFFDALYKLGIETKEKDLQIFLGGAKKADWDVGLAVDAIKLADKVDAVVLLSGDGDFCPLVEYLQGTKGCLVEVMSFRETTSSKLLDVADGFTDLSSDKRRYLMKSERRVGGQEPQEPKEPENSGNIYPVETPWS
ncbi:MAG: NYN domain-containing protein [Patescibacteria group bacterium]